MSKEYKDRRDRAKQDAGKYLANHVMIEEPVKSFRFHMHYVDKKLTRRQEGAYPFLRILPPVEGAKFGYNSTYAYTLTWTPGHMTIVGDLGELTVVHYHAMPTLEEACRWLLSPDYDYLLSKTNEQRQYDADATLQGFLQYINSEIFDHALGTAGWGKDRRRSNGDIHELRAWRRTQPRGGQLNEEEENVFEWLDNRPITLFDDPDRDCWQWWRAIAKHFGWGFDEGFILTAKGRRSLLRQFKDEFEHVHSAADFMQAIGFDDPPFAYEYRDHAFFQIAAIQHGTRMILDRLFPSEQVAA